MSKFVLVLFLLIAIRIPIRPRGEEHSPSYPTIATARISQAFGHLNHVGLDFNIGVGTAVYADRDGVIAQELETVGTYGRFLTIKHSDGYVSLYGHLSAFKTEKGQKVISGQLIALSGGNKEDKYAGSSSGAHLHWEIRPAGHTDTNKYNIDPMAYLLSFLHNKYQIAIVNSDKGLNVHLSPRETSVILYSLCSRDFVEIVEVENGWARLNAVRPEWVRLEYLEFIKGGL